MFDENIKIKASENQRYLDHDDENATEHINEITDFVSIENLMTKDFVKNNNIKIDYSTITLRPNGSPTSFLCPDGMSRINKFFTIVLCLRDSADNKDLFDKYVFVSDDIKFEYLDEEAVYTDGNYTQVNNIIEKLLYTNLSISECIVVDDSRYDQKYYFASQFQTYHKWIKNIPFKNDNQRINFFENLLDMAQVIYCQTDNDVNSFNGANILGKESNGDGQLTNKILIRLQSKYKLSESNRLLLTPIIKKWISFGCSPIRDCGIKPTKENLTLWSGYSMKSFETTSRGTTKFKGGNIDFMVQEIVEELSPILDKTSGSVTKKVKVQLEQKLKNNKFFNDFNSISRYRTEEYLKHIGAIWYPVLLKYERVKDRELNKEEVMVLLLMDLFNTIIDRDELWKGWATWCKNLVDNINSKTNLKTLLYETLINDKDIEFVNKLSRAFFGNYRSELSHPRFSIYSQLDKLLGHMSLKSNIKNWVSIMGQYKTSDDLIRDMEHFLSRKGSKSEYRFTSANFWYREKSGNIEDSNKSIKDKLPTIQGENNSLNLLFFGKPNVEEELKTLLNSDEYKVFKNKNFDNDDWIKVLSEEQDKNLIFKFRKKQIEITLGKIFK